MALCLFWCFRFNLEEYGRNEFKQVKKGEKLIKIYEAREIWTDRSTGQRRGSGFRETENCFLFQHNREGETY